MKRLLSTAVALSLLGGSAAMAQPHHDGRYDRHDRYGHDRDDRHHRWARGERLPSQYRGHGYYVDYRRYHLRAPPRGYQWVRVDNQYLLVAVTSGLIASIIAGG